jgi:hypothetical protein
MATIDFTSGQILIGVIEVFAPVTNVSTAITTSIHAAALYTITETRLRGPANNVTKRTRKPKKQSVKPSAIHSMVIIRLLSSETDPKPATTDLVGMRCPIPHKKIPTEPIHNNT